MQQENLHKHSVRKASVKNSYYKIFLIFSRIFISNNLMFFSKMFFLYFSVIWLIFLRSLNFWQRHSELLKYIVTIQLKVGSFAKALQSVVADHRMLGVEYLCKCAKLYKIIVQNDWCCIIIIFNLLHICASCLLPPLHNEIRTHTFVYIKVCVR